MGQCEAVLYIAWSDHWLDKRCINGVHSPLTQRLCHLARNAHSLFRPPPRPVPPHPQMREAATLHDSQSMPALASVKAGPRSGLTGTSSTSALGCHTLPSSSALTPRTHVPENLTASSSSSSSKSSAKKHRRKFPDFRYGLSVQRWRKKMAKRETGGKKNQRISDTSKKV